MIEQGNEDRAERRRQVHAEAVHELSRCLDNQLREFAALLVADLADVRTLTVEPNA